jgi:hypothetical protein
MRSSAYDLLLWSFNVKRSHHEWIFSNHFFWSWGRTQSVLSYISRVDTDSRICYHLFLLQPRSNPRSVFSLAS